MRILVADDHRLVRDGLKPFLEQLAENVVILDAATLDEAEAILDRESDLALILLDLNMPGTRDLDGLGRLRVRRPDVPIVILSGVVSRALVMAAVEAGAAGYIPKTIGGTALTNALRLVLAGEIYLPSVTFTQNLDDTAPAAAVTAAPLAMLSPREREILDYLVEGMTNKEIARKLDLQEITIKIHLRNVYRKIGAANRAQAVRIALSGGGVVPSLCPA